MKQSERTDIARTLPNAIDLITIGVEAGWSFDQCAQYIIEHYHTPFAAQLQLAYGEVASGRPRSEALRAMAHRCDLPELNAVVATIVTAEQSGASLAPLLRLQAEEVRRKHRQRIEEQVRKAPIKMTVTMIGCIFPALLAALLAPAAVRVLHDVMHVI